MKTRNFILLIILLLFPSNIFCQYKFKKLTIEEAMESGDIFRRSCMLDSSLVYYSTIYNSYDDKMSDKEKQICTLAYYWAAKITFDKGDFLTAFDLYLRGLKIIEQCKDKEGAQKIYKGLGDIYWTNMDLETTNLCYKYGYKLALQNNDSITMIRLANDLAGLNAELREFDKASHYLSIADKANKDTLIQRYMHLYINGLIEKYKGNYDNAIEYIQKSIKYAYANKLNPTYECYSHYHLYQLFTNTNEKDSMQQHLFTCYELLQLKPIIDLQPNCLKDMSCFYKSKEDYKNAYKYASEYISFTDSIFRAKDINRLKFLHRDYQDNKKTLKINRLEIEKSKNESTILSQKKTILAMAFAIMAIIIASVYLYWQKKRFAYLYNKLFNINTEVVASEQYNKTLRLKYENTINEKNQEIIRLKEELEKKQEKTEERHEDEIKKYTIQLKEEQKSSLLEAIDYIMQNTEEFCSIDFSLDKLAKMVNSNTTYVSQTINESYGKSFNTYVNEYRVREARKRLTDYEHYGNLTIKAISESVGYKSQTTFIKVFKEITGMTPSMFQKMTINKNL